jgi:peptidyl-prolyl cis-trans isomerase D
MLQSMRSKIKGLVAFFLIALLTIPLALVGVENLFYGNNNVGEAAEVNGTVITEREVQIAIGRERQRLSDQLGENAPLDLLSDESLRGSAIESLVQRSVLASLAKEGNMTFSNKEVDQTIVTLPDFQVDGKFDAQRFTQIVRSIGHTPTSFRALLKEDMLVNQVQNAVLSSDFITDSEIQRSFGLSRQTRDFSIVNLPLGKLPSTIDVSDEDVLAHYEANKSSYISEEQISVEYIELSVSDIEADMSVDEERIRQQYEQIVQSFTESTEREAAHIMIEGDDDAAQQKIATVKEKLAAGDDFAELAKEYSDDFGSRDNGGNLGSSTGDSFPEKFEETLLTLSEGQVSDAVTIDGATHFIQLLTVIEKTAPTYEEQKATIESELKRTLAEERFIEDVQSLEELAYNAESLAEVAETLALTHAQTALFSRENTTDDILQDKRVLTAAFSDDVVQQGHSSAVLELSADRVVVLKLIEHQPVRTLTLEEKTKDIVSELKTERAKAQLAVQVKEILNALDTGRTLVSIAEEQNLSFTKQVGIQRNASDVPLEILSLAFDMEKPDEGKVTIADQYIENGQYIIVSLSKVAEGNFSELAEAERTSLRVNLSASTAADEYRAWQDNLREESSISIYRSESPAL